MVHYQLTGPSTASLNAHTHTHTLNLRESTQNHSINPDTSAEKDPIEMFLCRKQWQLKERAEQQKRMWPWGIISHLQIKAADSKFEVKKKKS